MTNNDGGEMYLCMSVFGMTFAVELFPRRPLYSERAGLSPWRRPVPWLRVRLGRASL